MSDRTDINTMIRQLTEPVRHTERITQPAPNNDGTHTQITRTHTTTAPALLDQLAAAETTNGQQAGSRSGPTSTPVANIGAIDALIRIDKAAARWVRDLGEDDPSDTKACILKLNGLRVSAHRCDKPAAREQYRDHFNELQWRVNCCTQHGIEYDVREWWTTARCLTGWDEAPWRPDNTCPACEKPERRTLRIRLYEKLATCTKCGAVWGPDEIGLLAEHVRRENMEPEEGDAA